MTLSCQVIAQKVLGDAYRISAGEAYYSCPNHDDRHPSLKINTNKNVFLCGPCGVSGGAWAFAAFLARVGANEKKAVGAWLREHGFAQEKSGLKKKSEPEVWKEAKAFYYTPILRNVRFEGPLRDGAKPEKKYQWQHLENGEWKPGAAGMSKPLYVNQPFREFDQVDIAIGFEGEAKADLAGELGIPGFSYKYMTAGDCIKIAGIEVILWPDADQPGLKQAKVAAELLHQSGQPRLIRICALPLELPVSGDIVDAVKMLGWTASDIRVLCSHAVKYPPDPKPTGIRLSTVAAERAEWVWQYRIPRGAITILDGDPGTGKSTLALEIAARVSCGESLPDNGRPHPPRSVIILSAEDSIPMTVVPRLQSARANLENILAIPNFSDNPEVETFSRMPRDLKLLEKAIAETNAALVIVDVLAAYIPTEISMHRDQDVRNVLAPMSAMANRTGAAFVLLRHLNKNTGAAAIYRGGGSIGITGAARASLLLARDQANPDQRVLAVIKSNLGKIPQSVSLLIKTENELSRIEWQGFNSESADSLLAASATATPKDQEDRSALNNAIEWLTELLSGGPMSADDVSAHARENCIKVSTLRRAKDCLNIRSTRNGGFGERGKWFWELKNEIH